MTDLPLLDSVSASRELSDTISRMPLMGERSGVLEEEEDWRAKTLMGDIVSLSMVVSWQFSLFQLTSLVSLEMV